MTEIRSAVDFYARHPISAEIILAKLKDARGNLDNVRPEELFAHDQDHYGGLAVNDILADRAQIKAGSRVADFCAGLGGPARYLAHKYGADVTGIELTPARVAGAEQLTRLVGLQDKVRVLQGDVMQVPLPDGSMDAVISQEAFLHVPDLPRALGEARRILRPGGRFAFTTWVAERPLSEADRDLMWDGMAVQRLYSFDEMRKLLDRARFSVATVEDLTGEWATVLEQRLAMYRTLRSEAERAGTPAGHDAFYRSYVRLVELCRPAASAVGASPRWRPNIDQRFHGGVQAPICAASCVQPPKVAHGQHARGRSSGQHVSAGRNARTASMSPAHGPDEPVVEESPNDGNPDITLRALKQRIRQQEILSELGVAALQGATLDQLLNETSRLTAEGLRAEFCKVLEFIPDENRFLVRAGVGWDPGVVGVASIGADLASPAGFALRTGKPVISNHLENEERFRTPEILAEHGIYRAMNVILQGDGAPVRRAGGGQPLEGRVRRARHRLPAGSSQHPRHGHRARAPRAKPEGCPQSPPGTAQGDEPSGQEQPHHRLEHATSAVRQRRRRQADAASGRSFDAHPGDRPRARSPVPEPRYRDARPGRLHQSGLQGLG
jgi:cyclopropane fatty-acyl-phospholipid synthase-like methyltransferase